MPRDERKGKKRLNESEVASSEMEANLKAIEEDAKRAESERLRTLAQPQPQQQPKQQSSISEEDRKRIRESEIEQTKKQRNLEGVGSNPSQMQSIESSVDRYMADLSPEELEAKRNQLAQSQAIQQVSVSANSPVTVGSTIVESISDKDPNLSSETLSQARKNAQETNNIISNKKTEIVESLNDDIFLDPSQAQSKYISSGVISSQGQSPSYESTVTKEQLLKDQANNASKDLDDSSNAVLEKLGVQDYYPTVGRDIAVGTFTGSRLGSHTIYTGAGGLLPMGLYDARRKALAETAKNNQAKVQEFINIGDTYEPYNEAYKAYANNILLDGASRNGWDINKINKDVNLRKQRDRLIALQKEITETSTITDEIIANSKTKEGGTGVYYPPGVLDFAVKFRAGLLDVDEILEGRKRISNITQPLIGFSNGTKWADGQIKQWVSADSKVKVPISLKTGKELKGSDYKKIGEAVKAINDGLPDQDSYISLLKEYYGLDASVVNEWADINQIPKGDPSREWLKSYIEKQMPDESFTNEIKTFANKNFERYKFNKEFDYKKEKDKTFYTKVYEDGLRSQVNEKISKLPDNLTPAQYANEMNRIYREAGWNPRTFSNGSVFGVKVFGDDDKLKPKITTPIGETRINVKGKEVRITDITSNPDAYDDNVVAAARAIKANKVFLLPDESRISSGYYQNGIKKNVSKSNVGEFKSSKDKTTLVSTYGRFVTMRSESEIQQEIEKQKKAGIENPQVSDFKVISGINGAIVNQDISGMVGREALDRTVGKETQTLVTGYEE